MRNPGAASTNENPGAKIIQKPRVRELLFDKLERLFQTKGHDAAQMLKVHRFDRKSDIAGNGDLLTFDFILNNRRAMLDFELLSASKRNFQAVSQVVGDVIATDSQHGGVFDTPSE